MPIDKPVVFLDLDEVLEIHEHQVKTYGGEDGLRDLNLLKSAVMAPQMTWGGKFLHQDVFSMAAAYLLGIIQNHPFVDGNKRTGAVVAYVFLRRNGWKIVAPPPDFEEMILSVAKGFLDRDGIATFFRRNTLGDIP